LNSIIACRPTEAVAPHHATKQGLAKILRQNRVVGDGHILIRCDLGAAMSQKIDRDAQADIRQPNHLVPPQVLVQQHSMDKERDRTGASGSIGDAT
jgi:hypothetical protein